MDAGCPCWATKPPSPARGWASFGRLTVSVHEPDENLTFSLGESSALLVRLDVPLALLRPQHRGLAVAGIVTSFLFLRWFALFPAINKHWTPIFVGGLQWLIAFPVVTTVARATARRANRKAS